jgi:flagellar FliL protein
MSAVIASPGADVAPIPRGKKKLIVIAAAALVLVLALGAGAVFYLKQRAAHAAALALDDEATADHGGAPRIDPKNAPIYLPLDPFVVNLADKEADRYAQIGITLELDNGVSAEQIKAYMPAIRNAILMVLANKSSRELMNREGKEQLAQEIMREAVRPMGIEMAVPEPITVAPLENVVMAASAAMAGASAASVAASASGAASAIAVADAASAKPKAVAKRRLDSQRNPIQHVHFSSFIVQ